MKLGSIIRQILGRDTDWGIRIKRDNERIDKILSNLLKSNSNCIDIGAHEGSFLDLYKKFAPKGGHHAFEPLPEYYQLLTVKYTNISIYKTALSDFEGETVFYRPQGAEAMSGLKRQQYPFSETLVDELRVNVKRLDDVISEEQAIEFIKLDVEGAELNVLRGGIKLIRRAQPVIMFEFAKIHIAEYDVTPTEIYNFFSHLDYKIFRLDGKEEYSLAAFEKVFNSSHLSNYNRIAETNFLACPKNKSI